MTSVNILDPIHNPWVLYDPETDWTTYTDEAEARAAYDSAFDRLRDQSSDGWHEEVERLALYRLTPVVTTRLRITTRAEDDTEAGEECRRAGWDYIAEAYAVEVPDPYEVLRQQLDDALQACATTQRENAELLVALNERGRELVSLRVEVDRLQRDALVASKQVNP